MGRRSLVLCVAVLLALPTATVLAGGKGSLQAPPGMLKAEAKIGDEMQQVTDEYLDQYAALQQQIDEVEPFADMGDPAAQDELAALTAQCDELTDEYWQTIGELNDEAYAIYLKIQDWQEKHGITAPPPQ